jgi:hypothetical protein
MTNHSILYRLSILFVLLTWNFGCDTRTQSQKTEDAEKVIQQLGVVSAPKESPVSPPPTPTLEEVNSDTEIDSIAKSIVASDAATIKSAPKAAKDAPTKDDPSKPWISESQLPREIWEVQYVGNTPVGYQRRKTEIDSNGSEINPSGKKKRVRIEAESRIRVSLQGKPQDQHIIVSTLENELGELRSIDVTLQIGDITNTRTGKVENGMLILEVNTNGTKTKENIKWQSSFRGPFAVEQSMMRLPLEKNESRELKYFDPIQGKLVKGRLEADSEYFKTPTLFGGERELLEVRNTGTIGDLSVQALMWVDEQGEGYKSYMQSADIRSFRTEPIEAQKIASLFDLRAMASKSTPLQGDVTPLLKLKSDGAPNTFEAKHDSALYSHFSRRCSQRVVSIDPTTVEITPFSIGPDSKHVDDEPEESTLDPKTLAASPFVPSTSKTVLDLANAFGKIFPENASVIDKVTICSMGLNKRVAQIEFNGQIATVTDILKNKRADCVEHALLLASICRAMNIPARVALGAIFNHSQEKPEMKFHAWIEIHDGNRWIPFDSTDDNFPVSIDRIKMRDTLFESANPYLEILNACKLLSELKIRLLPQ